MYSVFSDHQIYKSWFLKYTSYPIALHGNLSQKIEVWFVFLPRSFSIPTPTTLQVLKSKKYYYSDLLWGKILLGVQKNFFQNRGWRPKIWKILENFATILQISAGDKFALLRFQHLYSPRMSGDRGVGMLKIPRDSSKWRPVSQPISVPTPLSQEILSL